MSNGGRRQVDPTLDAWLADGAGAGEACGARHETPIAKVYVFADRVLKLKKPVDFGFLDFTTPDKREWAARRELAFNRRTAPDVYRAVHAVVRRDGGMHLGGDAGEGEVVDWVLEMRPFDTEAILANHPEQVDGALAERLGRDIAGFQADAPLTPQRRGAAGLAYVINSNADQLRSLKRELGEAAVEGLIADTQAAFDRQAALLDQRRDAGFVRRCHGDLHLGNIVVEDGWPLLFDCIEFSEVLSEIDVLYDTGFLLMDLDFRDRRAAANRVLNAWLDQSGRTFDTARLGGLAALPLFQAIRAAVRTHVSGHAGDLETARRYMAAAQAHLTPPPPTLYAVGGVSGTGKSTLARALAPRLGAPPGAVVLRSDEIRKRLWGVGPTDPLAKSAYTAEASGQVYAQMLAEARVALCAGWPVLLDAAFLQAAERRMASDLADDLSVPFRGLWLAAPAEVLRQRVADRQGDASDADAAVLERQLQHDLGEIDWPRIDAAAPGEDQMAAAEADR